MGELVTMIVSLCLERSFFKITLGAIVAHPKAFLESWLTIILKPCLSSIFFYWAAMDNISPSLVSP